MSTCVPWVSQGKCRVSPGVVMLAVQNPQVCWPRVIRAGAPPHLLEQPLLQLLVILILAQDHGALELSPLSSPVCPWESVPCCHPCATPIQPRSGSSPTSAISPV